MVFSEYYYSATKASILGTTPTYTRLTLTIHGCLLITLAVWSPKHRSSLPVAWLHPHPCSRGVDHHGAQTSVAANFSWCFSASSASHILAPAPVGRESKTWKVVQDALLSPGSWCELEARRTAKCKKGDISSQFQSRHYCTEYPHIFHLNLI